MLAWTGEGMEWRVNVLVLVFADAGFSAVDMAQVKLGYGREKAFVFQWSLFVLVVWGVAGSVGWIGLQSTYCC